MSLYQEYEKLAKQGKFHESSIIYDFNYRIEMSYDYIILLQKYISEIKVDERDELAFEELKEIINNPKQIKRSIKKQNAIALATKVRSSKVKEKINNAINVLRLQDKEFTHYNIAKEAGVSFVTVKKYLSKELLEQLNKKELKKIY